MGLTAAERLARLRLARTNGIGPVTFSELLARFGSAEAAVDALPSLAKKARRALNVVSAKSAQAELDETEALDGRVLVLGEDGFPVQLATLDPPPPVIVIRGDLALASRPLIALVGARNASVAGRKMAGELAGDLGRAGFVIASGLARGIDTAAHKASLATGTIAVIANGIDGCYPKENEGLQEAVFRQGLVVTEMPLGTEPLAKYFPRRNRLIAGLAAGTVVVEAALRSGSLITARLALEQGREVLAVPGSPLDPRCRGANRLIKQGAALIENADDVLAVLDPARLGADHWREPVPASAAGDSFAEIGADTGESERSRLLEALSPAPTTLDELARATGLPMPLLRGALLELDLEGIIERTGPQSVALAASPDSR